MRIAVGLDIGTSGAKAVALREDGTILGSSERSYGMSTPHPGWTEQDPEDWFRAAKSCLVELDLQPDVLALTGQMHGSVLLDKDDAVIRPALLWNDQRTATQTSGLDREHGEAIRRITLNPPMTGFQLPKVLWVREQEPQNFARVRRVLLPKDYVAFRLTGQSTTDPSDASGTGVFDVQARGWSAELLSNLDLDPDWFPGVVESGLPIGTTGEGVLIVSGAGDQAAAAVGTGAIEPKLWSICLGTSGVVFRSLPGSPRGCAEGIHTFAHANGGWHQMGVQLACGGAIQWFQRTFAPSQGFEEVDRMAGRAKSDTGVFFVPSLSGERCPEPAPLARAGFAGLSMGTTLDELAAAVYQGTTFQLLEIAEAMGIKPGATLRVTGGGARSNYWIQLLANTLQCHCQHLEVDEGPAHGAAMLAMRGLTSEPLEKIVDRSVRITGEVEPNKEFDRKAYARWQSLVGSTRAWDVAVQ